MPSSAEMRQECARCLEAARNTADPAVKVELIARALQLAQEAEALDRAAGKPPEPTGKDPESRDFARETWVLQQNIERYRRLIATGLDEPTRREVVRQLTLAEQELAKAIVAGRKR